MRSPPPSPSTPSIVVQRTHDLKSRMRESRTSGSVGAPGGRLPGATRLFFCGVHRWALTRVPPAELVPLVPLLASPARFHVGVEPDSSAVHEDLVPDDVLLVARRAGEQIGQGVGRLGGCEDRGGWMDRDKDLKVPSRIGGRSGPPPARPPARQAGAWGGGGGGPRPHRNRPPPASRG